MVITDIKNPRWSYATSKGLGEQLRVNSNLNYIIIRPRNIYGPNKLIILCLNSSIYKK